MSNENGSKASGIFERAGAAAEVIRGRSRLRPKIGIILGTGLGMLATKIADAVSIPYDEIPGFVFSTVESHHGRLLVGTIAGVPVAALQGRFHFYEGYSFQEITFPVRVLRAFGIETLLISNAAGGLHPDMRRGDLMIIRDHINLQGSNPLIGRNDDRLGPRFPDMCEPYDRSLVALAAETARGLEIRHQLGVYAAVTGPCLETPAEYRTLKIIGADAVGMSTVPEVIVAKHAGMRVLGVSVVTDLANTDVISPVAIEEIIEVAGRAEPHLTRLFEAMIPRLV